MNPDLTLFVFVAIFGAIIGSFLTVCIHRLPLKRFSEDTEKQKMNLYTPARSVCPSCGKQLLWWHNIPILSWFLLGGRCAFCRAPVSARYPAVELLTVLVAVLSYHRFGLSPTAVLIFFFAAVLIVITFIDIDFMIIPDVLSIPGIWLGMALSGFQYFTGQTGQPFFQPPISQSLWDGGIGLFLGYGMFRGIAELYLWLRKKEGLGLGDVKLLGMIGAFFGAQCVLFTIFFSSLLGSIGGIFFLVAFKRRFDQPLPFGPFIVLAALIFIFGFDHSQGTVNYFSLFSPDLR